MNFNILYEINMFAYLAIERWRKEKTCGPHLYLMIKLLSSHFQLKKNMII